MRIEPRYRWFILASTLCVASLLESCTRDQARVHSPPRNEVVVSGFATLPVETYSSGPPSGATVDPSKALLRPPFPSQPVQGFSAAISRGEDELVFLVDNGFGTIANSADFFLRLYRARVDFEEHEIRIQSFVELADPKSFFPSISSSAAADATKSRTLTGADFDPESLALASDGSYWVGEERGPWLLHFSATGELMEPPLAIPVPNALLSYARGQTELRSPDHPALAGLDEHARMAAANVGRSKGLEALAAVPGGKLGYVILEGPLTGDADRTRLPVMEFDFEKRAFTGEVFWYRLERDDTAVTDAAAMGAKTLVVIERDSGEGEAAQIKRVYEVRLDRASPDGRLEKRLVADLLNLRDPDDHGPSRKGVLRMPQLTPECVVVLGPRSLLVATDNNFPFGRARDPDEAEETELVRIELPQPLR